MYAYLQSVFWFHEDGVVATKLRIGEGEETRTGILHTDIWILHIQPSVYCTYVYLHNVYCIPSMKQKRHLFFGMFENYTAITWNCSHLHKSAHLHESTYLQLLAKFPAQGQSHQWVVTSLVRTHSCAEVENTILKWTTGTDMLCFMAMQKQSADGSLLPSLPQWSPYQVF